MTADLQPTSPDTTLAQLALKWDDAARMMRQVAGNDDRTDAYASALHDCANELRVRVAKEPPPPSLTLAAFSEINRARCEASDGFNHKLGSWSLSDWFTAIMGELGEAANIAKKLNRVRDGITGNKESPEELRDKIASELADTFIYLDLTAQSLGLSLADIVTRTFDAKSAQIGYPIRVGDAGHA